MKTENNLTHKQEKFVHEYLTDFNATRAYQEVYKCNYDSARARGSELLANINIKQYIDNLLSNINDKIDENWILTQVIWNYKKAVSEGKDVTAKGYLELLMKYKAMLTERNINIGEDFEAYVQRITNKTQAPVGQTVTQNEESANISDKGHK